MRIAAFQRTPIDDDPAATVATMLRDLRWADAQHIDLAIFPECWLGGHAYDRATIARRAFDFTGPEIAALIAPLRGIAASAIVGAFEIRGAKLFNAALLIARGRIVGCAAKAHPNEDGVTPGADMRVFNVAGLPIGVAICNDANFPGPAQQLADLGARLICYPLNNMLRPETAAKWRGRSIENLRDRARQTGCWIASSDVAGARAGLVSHGCTAIVAPDGDVIARAWKRIRKASCCSM